MLASLRTDKENNLGNLLFKLPDITQLSYQNKIFFPFPTTQLTLSSNFLPHSSKLYTFIKSLYHKETLLLSFCSSFRPLHPLYLDSITSLHNPPLSEFKRHIHFPSNVRLKLLTLMISSPPTFLELQTLSQATHAIFLPYDLQPNKKFLCKLTIFFNTLDDKQT